MNHHTALSPEALHATKATDINEANFWLGAPPPGVKIDRREAFLDSCHRATGRMGEALKGGNALSPNPKDAIGRAKAALNLLPAPALVEIAKAMRLGADKYGAYNWRESKVARTVYTTAAQRHILADQDGETFDPDVAFGNPAIRHLALACASLMIALDAEANGMMLDDRGPKGVAGELMRGAPGESVPVYKPLTDDERAKLKAEAVTGGIVQAAAPPPRPASRPFLWYLATPYSASPDGLDVAYVRAAVALSELLRRGVQVFCPITHGHEAGKVLPRDHDFWMDVDRPFMDRCDGLLVLKQPGWKESAGIKEEVRTFERAGKPVFWTIAPPLSGWGIEPPGFGWDGIASELSRIARGQA